MAASANFRWSTFLGCISRSHIDDFSLHLLDAFRHREDASIGCRTLCLAQEAANTNNQCSNQLDADEQRTTKQIILPPHLNPQVESTMPRHPTKSICKSHICGGRSRFTVCSTHRSRTSWNGEIGQILLFLEQTVASSYHSLLQHEQDLAHLTDRGRP